MQPIFKNSILTPKGTHHSYFETKKFPLHAGKFKGHKNYPCGQKVELFLVKFFGKYVDLLIPVAARSKTWVCGRSLSGTAGSNSAQGGMDVCLL